MPKDISRFDYVTFEWDERYSWFSVKGWDTWPRRSVLEGQARKTFLDSFPTEEEVLAAYPTATGSSKWIQPQNTFDHLPGEDDPVPGGMYPDDIGGWPPAP